jgi:Chitin binding Peritrophin-A domain
MLRLGLALVALSFGTLVTGQSCPPDGVGYLPHETLCNSYYFCTTGAANLRRCPGDLHWDNDRRFCAHPDSFVCTLRDLRCPEVSDPLDLVYLANSLDCTR